MGNQVTEDPDIHLLSTLNDNQAQLVLMHLIRSDPHLVTRAVKVARALIGGVSRENVADDVCDALTTLDVHQLWAESGGQWDGYVDPYEHAYEMMEELVEPYVDEMEQYLVRNMPLEAVEYGKGIIDGICRYVKYESGEFGEWISGSDDGLSGDVIDRLKETCSNKALISDIESFRSDLLYEEEE